MFSSYKDVSLNHEKDKLLFFIMIRKELLLLKREFDSRKRQFTFVLILSAFTQIWVRNTKKTKLLFHYDQKENCFHSMFDLSYLLSLNEKNRHFLSSFQCTQCMIPIWVILFCWKVWYHWKFGVISWSD